MEVAKLTDDLDKLLSKEAIRDSDVFDFVKSLVVLSKEVKSEEGFRTFGPIVKQWMRAYKPIFSDKKMDDSAKMYIRKSSKVLTYVFLSLMQAFDKYESTHSLEFYCQWKHIMSQMNPQKLANYVCLYGQQFKGLIENLRTATNRCDQLSILVVLLLYTEQLSSDQLNELKENFNSYILEKLAALNNHPDVLMNQHSFLHDIDAMGHCIISLKPTKIICDEISLNLNTSIQALWIDFNMRENSIVLVAVSPIENVLTFLATVTRPKLTERLSEEHELKIRGSWSVMNGPGVTFLRQTTMIVYLPIHDRNAVWKTKVKSIFRFVSGTPIYNSQSISSQESMAIDRRLLQFEAGGVQGADGVQDRHYVMSQNNESFTSFSMSGSQFRPKSIAPIARKQLDADEISFFGDDRANVPATKDSVDIAVSEKSPTDRGTLADLSFEQEAFIDPSHEPPYDPLNDTRHDPLDHPIDEPLEDHLSDHSSGISFGDDMSVLEDGQSEIGMSGPSESGSLSSCHESFPSVDSSLSEIDKQVKRFIAGTQDQSGQQTSQPRIQHPDENVSIAKITDSVRDIIGSIAATSIDESNGEQTKSPKNSPSPYKRNSFKSLPTQSASFLSPVETEDAKNGDIQFQNGSVHASLSNFDSLKEMLRNEKTNEPLGGDSYMADGNNRRDEPVNLQPNPYLIPNEADTELVFDDEGMVSDRRGCVFVNSDEIEEALYVYMENNGLEYLKSEAFKAADAVRRQRTEREFRAIHKMIDNKFEEDAYSPNGSLTDPLRGTAKRKLWNSLNDESTSMCSSQSDAFEQPTKRRKSSEESFGNEPNAGVTKVATDEEPNVDNQKLQGVSCALTQLNGLIGHLKDFFETRETCEFHRVKLLHLITELQANNIAALRSKEKFSDTVTNVRTMCRQARECAAMIVNKTYKQ
ncbi:uncharacterized protein LOC119076433 [Bradysia coprophila]|uniref:uncharacterized protein LOC119076433 n=1 Tax=Bradysia coprophila TaxID=38358 RepID=UPI00187D78C1|nr:uncharacterized protein LOC119076433 [Bradysia coprophila]